MSTRTDRTRNADFNRERARVEYAQRRLTELRAQGSTDAAAKGLLDAVVERCVTP